MAGCSKGIKIQGYIPGDEIALNHVENNPRMEERDEKISSFVVACWSSYYGCMG